HRAAIDRRYSNHALLFVQSPAATASLAQAEFFNQLLCPRPRPGGGRFGSGVKSAGNKSNTAFIAVTALACSAMSLSGPLALELISDIFWYAATADFSLISTLFLKSGDLLLIEVPIWS